jgi:hypothetical protein
MRSQQQPRRSQGGPPPTVLIAALCTLAALAQQVSISWLRPWKVTKPAHRLDLMLHCEPRRQQPCCGFDNTCLSDHITDAQGTAAAAGDPVTLQVVLTGAPDGSISTAFIQRKSGVPIGGPLPALYASQQLLNAQPYVSGKRRRPGTVQMHLPHVLAV